MVEILNRGRSAFDRHDWSDAYAHLAAANDREPLEPEDLERLAVAAHLIGSEKASDGAWERAHQAFLERDEVARAVRCAFWLAILLVHRGEMARGGGWLARCQRLLDDRGLDCAERGFLQVAMALRTLEGGAPSDAYPIFGRAAEEGQRFGEPDLVTLALLGQGRSLVRMGRTAEGLTVLDEAMVSVTTEEVSAIVAGTVYCAVILVCRDAFDLRRAHEWTAALGDWCDAQPDLVPFRGQCLVHRSEIMQMHGDWAEALDEVRHARDRLSDPPGQPAIGLAYYQLGELLRLRGEFSEAEDAYRQASELGRQPYPGLAKLRLAQGRVQAAEAAIRRVVDEAQGPTARAKVLPALVEILLASGDAGAAREAADDLTGIAADLDASLLHAMSAATTGGVLLAEGDAKAALLALHDACARWRALEAPYEEACAGLLAGLACRELADLETAEMEIAAAQQTFRRLGAAPDEARAEALLHKEEAAGGLTAREVQVLGLAAKGMKNRQIAAELVVSEHTVRRHLQNIYVKLGVSSRAAATAYALEHGLI